MGSGEILDVNQEFRGVFKVNENASENRKMVKNIRLSKAKFKGEHSTG